VPRGCQASSSSRSEVQGSVRSLWVPGLQSGVLRRVRRSRAIRSKLVSTMIGLKVQRLNDEGDPTGPVLTVTHEMDRLRNGVFRTLWTLSDGSQAYPGDLCRVSTAKVPNLDALSPQELHDFAVKWRRCGQHDAEDLVGVRLDSLQIARNLADYASARSEAARWRLLGKVDLALECEQRLQRLYANLPLDCRW
jgi:hypothetical protein